MSGGFGVIIGLALGIFSMTRGGELNAKYGNKLMRARVASQFLALMLLAAAFMMRDG